MERCWITGNVSKTGVGGTVKKHTVAKDFIEALVKHPHFSVGFDHICGTFFSTGHPLG